MNAPARSAAPIGTRVVRGGVVFLVLASLLAPVPPVAAQDGYRGWESIRDPGFTFDPDAREFRNYQVGRAPQVRELLDKYESLLAERAVMPALRHLQEILDEHGASVVQVSNEPHHERYVGAAEYARWLLINAPPEVRAAYEKLAELNGREQLARARADGDWHALRTLARRYATALIGHEALLSLAQLHRERGARGVAAFHARRLLDFTVERGDGDGWRDESARARVAAIAAEARAIAALSEGSAVGLVRDDAAARAPLVVAGAERPLEDFLRGTTLRPRSVPADEWPTFGGDAARARHAAPPVRGLDLGRTFPFPVEHPLYPGERSPLAGMDHAPVQPIRLGDRLYVSNSLSVKCFDLLARAPVWEFEGAQARVRGRGEDGFLAVHDYDPSNDYDDPTWSRALVVGLSAGGDVVLANLQVPQAANVKVHQGFRINDPCPWRGLVALDANDGKLKWEQRPLVRNAYSNRLEYPELRRRGDPDAILPRLDVPAPPAIVDDVVFALGHFFEGAINTYLCALELETGEPLYCVPLVIGQQELSMFNMPFQEFTTGSPSFWNGTVYCPTNVGLVAAVDATFGDLRWLSAYEALRIIPPDNYFRNRPRPVFWYSRGPHVADDLLLVTPHDSVSLISLDPSTGKERFVRDLPGGDPRYPTAHLVGVVDGLAIVAIAAAGPVQGSSGKVIALRTDNGKVRWDYPQSGGRGGGRRVDLIGTGVVTDRHVWLPLEDEILVLDASDGSQVDSIRWSPDEPRNLLLFPDMLIAASRSDVVVAFDPAEALRELRLEVERRGETPDLLVRIGSLERQSGELAQAARTMRRAVVLATESTVAPAELARVRAALCSTLIEIADLERRAARTSAAASALIEAEGVADDPETRAAIVADLLEVVAPASDDDRAIRWLTRLREQFAAARVSVPGFAPRPVPIAIWTGLELARRREERGELELALAELQRVQTDWPPEPLAERDSVSVAQARVAEILAAAPAAVREKYDRDAEAAFAAAVEAVDVERLALLLRRFPSAASAPRYAARELELLRAHRRPAEALVVGADLLRARPNESLVRSATVELARAARDVGNPVLAQALVRRLAIGPEGAVPDDLRDFADEVEPLRPQEKRLELVRTLVLEENASLLGASERLRGDPLPPDFDSLLLLVPDLEFRIVRLGLPDGDRRWEVTLPRARLNDYAPQVLHVAGTLVARRGSMLMALDLERGDVLWQKDLDRDVVDLASASGMLLTTQVAPRRDESSGEPVRLTLVEPRTGRELAAVPLAGTDTRVGQLRGAGPYCVASSMGLSHTAEVFDAVTGARLLDPRSYLPMLVLTGAPLLLAEERLMILPDTRPAPGEFVARQGGTQRVNAYRLGSGEQAWSFDLLPLAYKLRYLYATTDGFAVLGGTQPDAQVLVIDPDTGGPLRPEQRLPPDLTDGALGSQRILIHGDEPTVRLQAFWEWRKNEPLGLVVLGGDGDELWRRTLELPKNAVRVRVLDRMHRRGGALVAMLQVQAGGKYRTEVIVLDEATGEVLDRHAFEDGEAGQNDELVRTGDLVVLRQKRAVHVMGWR